MLSLHISPRYQSSRFNTMGMWVVMAGPKVRVVGGHGMEMDLRKVWAL